MVRGGETGERRRARGERRRAVPAGRPAPEWGLVGPSSPPPVAGRGGCGGERAPIPRLPLQLKGCRFRRRIGSALALGEVLPAERRASPSHTHPASLLSFLFPPPPRFCPPLLLPSPSLRHGSLAQVLVLKAKVKSGRTRGGLALLALPFRR